MSPAITLFQPPRSFDNQHRVWLAAPGEFLLKRAEIARIRQMRGEKNESSRDSRPTELSVQSHLPKRQPSTCKSGRYRHNAYPRGTRTIPIQIWRATVFFANHLAAFRRCIFYRPPKRSLVHVNLRDNDSFHLSAQLRTRWQPDFESSTGTDY